MIDAFKTIVDNTLTRSQRIGALRRPKAPTIGWNESKRRFERRPDESEFFETTVINRLGELILGYGHLLKECAAPAKMKPGRKSKNGAEEAPRGKCGKKFIATKDTQLYYSPACLDRALSHRADEKPRKRTAKQRRAKPKRRSG